MARSLPSDRPIAPQRSKRGLALALPGSLAVWVPLLLALLTLVALVAAYSMRPTMRVELGEYYDSAYLEGFHARELDASGVARTWEWSPTSNEMTIPGGLDGDWMATVQAREDLPGRPVSGVALKVNGAFVRIPRDSSHEFTAFVPSELAAAEQLTLQVYGTPAGTPDPEPGTIARVVLSPARTYRWTGEQGRITLPGLGRGAWRLDMAVVAAHPNEQPVDAQVLVNGEPLAALPESPQFRRVSLLVPPDLMHSGTMDITLRANTFEDPRPLGLLVSEFGVQPLESTPLLPPPGAALASLVVVLGTYASLALLLREVGPLTVAPGSGTARRLPPLWVWLAACGALAVLVPGAWALAAHRYPTSFMLPGLAGLALWSLVLLLVLRPLLAWALGPERRTLINLLLLVFFVGYWLKAGGMLYPYFIGIDINWHMDRVRWILDGQLGLLYGTDSPLNESTMPVAEWGTNRPVIPYSPYFHMFATVFALLPWSLEFSANMLHALLDCSHVLIIGVLAYRLGLSQRGAVLAALLYAVLPLNVLLLSWGNMPTTFGLWWVLLMTAFAVVAWPRLHKRLPFGVLVVLLLASLLFYTVAGAFTGLFLLCFTLALWLAARRSGAGGALLAGLRPLWLATAVALGLALLIYYAQYIPPIIQRTLPYFAEALFGAGHEDTGRVSDTFSAYLLRHGRLLHYGLVVPLLLTAAYLVWQWVARFRLAPDAPAADTRPVLLWAAVAGWVGVMLVFFPLAYKISMVDKHFIVAVPFLAIASGAVLDRLWHSRAALPVRGLTALYYIYLGAAALSLWLHRIIIVQQVSE